MRVQFDPPLSLNPSKINITTSVAKWLAKDDFNFFNAKVGLIFDCDIQHDRKISVYIGLPPPVLPGAATFRLDDAGKILESDPGF